MEASGGSAKTTSHHLDSVHDLFERLGDKQDILQTIDLEGLINNMVDVERAPNTVIAERVGGVFSG
tara:strand:+ start:493 stop:690 length:198 start_codon:yes stop_codon:yes gene_type:complete